MSPQAKAGASCDDDLVAVEGTMRVGGQEHFYLEVRGLAMKQR